MKKSELDQNERCTSGQLQNYCHSTAPEPFHGGKLCQAEQCGALDVRSVGDNV